MRAARATFLLLLFLTSFGRCWADTYGLLSNSSWACCAPVDAASHDHDHEVDHTHASMQNNDGSTAPEPYPASDCSGCSLIRSGYTSTVIGFDLNAPISLDFVPEWDDLHLRIQRMLSWAEEAQESPPAWSMDRVVLTISEIVTTSAISVRGPNLA